MMDTQTTIPDDRRVAPAGDGEESPPPDHRWLIGDWSRRSWWIKAPFLLTIAALIIAAKLGAHFAFEWLKHHLH